MASVLVIGGVSWDALIYVQRLPEPKPHTVFSEGFHETVGGTGGGKALNLAHLDFEVSLHAQIGADPPGQQIRQRLDAAHIHFMPEIDPAGTERHTNLLDSLGRRLSIYTSYATFEPDFDLAPLEAAIPQHDYLVLNIINYCRHLIPAARQSGKPIWCDIHDYDGQDTYHRDFIAAADYLMLSSDALPDYRRFMQQQIESGKRLVIATHGAKGATALTADGQWIETPIIETYEYVDSSGAGDAFFSGVMYGFAQGYEVEHCLRLGAIAGGLCITGQELAHPDLSPARIEAEYAQHFG
jgi:sugar/nucleoside kinase (ribokinase family)